MNKLGWAGAYMLTAIFLAILISKSMKRLNPCQHEWEYRGYDGVDWSIKACKHCDEEVIDS